MNWHYHQIIKTTSAHIFLLCLFVLSFCVSCNAGKAVVAHRKNITCIGQERDALLKFKHHIQRDYCGLMSSWGNPNKPDCCTWKGVTCSKQSGHVIGLNLSGAPYEQVDLGCLDSHVLSPSLWELKHLKYLDLSSNYFHGMDIPTSIGSLVNLIHLNLAGSYFGGNIPNHLGNLTSLTSLDLSNNNWLSALSLNWLFQLTSLRVLSLSGTNLRNAKHLFRIIASLHLLEVLKMDESQLPPTPPPSSTFLQSANLRVISLSGNNFNGFSSFQWLLNTSNSSSVKHPLKYLDLSRNLLQGPIPDAIRNLESLIYLDLSQNSLSSTIPDAIGNLEFLTHLDLSRNSLSSTIPDAIGNLQSLTYVDLSENSLSGPIPSTLGSSGSLSYLDVSINHLEGVIPSSIANLENLGYLDLSSNNLSGDIPCKLEIKTPPYFANFSNNNLSGSVPTYFSYPGFDAFQGNPNFHRDEVQGPCDHKDNDKANDKIYPGLYVSIGVGIYTGFWAFCGTLTIKNSWRHAYFRFLDHIIDKIYVTVAIYLARFRRNSQM